MAATDLNIWSSFLPLKIVIFHVTDQKEKLVAAPILAYLEFFYMYLSPELMAFLNHILGCTKNIWIGLEELDPFFDFLGS